MLAAKGKKGTIISKKKAKRKYTKQYIWRIREMLVAKGKKRANTTGGKGKC